MLSENLEDLEKKGLVERQVGNGRPVRVDDALTEHGEALAPVIEEMVDWGEEYLRDADSPAESVV